VSPFLHGITSTGILYPGAPVRPGTQYFYRVFARDEYGLLGGSNLVEAQTLDWPKDAYGMEYDLVQIGQFAGHALVQGIAYDGVCLWIAYAESSGATTLACRDLTSGTESTSWPYPATLGSPRGLAWDGTSLWMLHDEGFTVTARAVDPSDGSVVRQFLVSGSAIDLDWDGQHLLVAETQGWVDIVDPLTGGLVGQIETPVSVGGLRAVAQHAGDTWIGGWFHGIGILDSGGHIAGVAYTSLFTGNTGQAPEFMTFVGDDILLVNGIYGFLLTPTPR